MCALQATEVLVAALTSGHPAEHSRSAKAMVAVAFDEWMRRYIKEPERFRREWQTVGEFLSEQAAGKATSYGKRSAAYLAQLVADVSDATVVNG